METIRDKWADNWIKLAKYLSDERMEGKTEFVLSFQNDCDFIIHPEGKDGKTLDLSICVSLPEPPEKFGQVITNKERDERV